jgi:hypothetical protein
MTWRDLPLPPAIAAMIALLLEAVSRGVRMAVHGLAHGEMRRTRRIVTRITAILRHVIFLLAVRVEVRVRAPPPPLRPVSISAGAAAAPCFDLWSTLPTNSRHPVVAAGEAQDPGLRGCGHQNSLDPGRGPWPPQDDGRWSEKTFQRKLAGIRAALADPLRYARRIARALHSPRCLILPPKVPRTIPNTDEREFWDERLSVAEEARFAYHQYWAQRRDTS